jgi:hypothetical protein
MSNDENLSNGWGLPSASRKWHFFANEARSLCGKWFYLGPREKPEQMGGGKDDCAVCVKKRATLHHPDDAPKRREALLP